MIIIITPSDVPPSDLFADSISTICLLSDHHPMCRCCNRSTSAVVGQYWKLKKCGKKSSIIGGYLATSRICVKRQQIQPAWDENLSFGVGQQALLPRNKVYWVPSCNVPRRIW